MKNEYEYEIKAEGTSDSQNFGGHIVKAKTPKYTGKLVEDFCEVLRHGDSITILKRLKDDA